ncbi:glycoside hydrolase family 9 protein [uncultured Ferrimonas sp.]|uniref:glycoside hydrolase family 9 protein n=1 Tax=uncultured Ferrimonas sp. TaxID=432640 RepID=UPI002618E47E|nr:glycoside hydrolase family 9 protein [uncultured Ferrimonas sp.]
MNSKARMLPLALLIPTVMAADAPPSVAVDGVVRVNQAGYLPGQTNMVFPQFAGKLELIDVVSGKTVAQLKAEQANQPLQLPTSLPSGWYQLQSEQQRSVVFEVSDSVLDTTLETMLRAYRYQHAGKPIRDPHSGVQRPPAHLQDGVIAHDDPFHQAGDSIDGSGGWYDAGDYGKYIATTAITAARLMDAAGDKQQGPEQSPLLQEALVGLNWMTQMQRQDGAFYRKIGAKKWPDLVPPHLDRQTRYVYGVATPDTAKAVAALAQAARIYQDWDQQRAAEFLEHAEQGWKWLEQQPVQAINWHPGDDGGSGPYMYNKWDTQASLQHDEDDRFWAAAELYLTTLKPQYLSYAVAHMPASVGIYEWKDPSVLGMWHLLLSGNVDALSDQIQLKFESHCQLLRNNAYNSEFQVSNQRFIWGSNKMVAEEGILFGYCYRLTQNREYLQLAWSQWNYLFGVNPFNLSYVTGIGQNAVQNLHHIWGRAVNFVPPGMMVGGPNQDAQAGFAPKAQGMRSYIDEAKDYSVNEFAIDYNASAIGLAALLANPDAVQLAAAQR